MHQIDASSAVSLLLRHRLLRLVLLAAPAVTATVAMLTAVEPNLTLRMTLNVAVGVVISSVLFLAISIVSRQPADDRFGLMQAAHLGPWNARWAHLLSIRHHQSGLYSYWYFRLRLQEELERSQRYSLNLAVLLVKSPGHIRNGARPDSEWFGNDIHRYLRRSDLPALLRDGSLGIVLPHTAAKAAETLRRRLANSPDSLNAAIGLACYPADGQDVSELLAAADRAARGQSAAMAA